MKKKRKRRSLKELLSNKLLTGIYLEDGLLYLRLTDAVITVDLNTREWSFSKKRRIWLVFPGLLRIAQVQEDHHQVVLIISGAIFSSKISLRKKKEWNLLLDANFVY